jgi:hypothetical protein
MSRKGAFGLIFRVMHKVVHIIHSFFAHRLLLSTGCGDEIGRGKYVPFLTSIKGAIHNKIDERKE